MGRIIWTGESRGVCPMRFRAVLHDNGRVSFEGSGRVDATGTPQWDALTDPPDQFIETAARLMGDIAEAADPEPGPFLSVPWGPHPFWRNGQAGQDRRDKGAIRP